MNGIASRNNCRLKTGRILVHISLLAFFLFPNNTLAQDNIDNLLKIHFDHNASVKTYARYIQTETSQADTVISEKLPYPVFIFIPGILGSRLSIVNPDSGEENIIWGRPNLKDIICNTESLCYSKTQPVVAKPLHSIKIMRYRFDIYGDFAQYVKDTDWSGRPSFFYFPYDWRQDNRLSAEKLDSNFREWETDLDKREVIFICHSMGGLVFKWWYHKIYIKRKQKYPFTIGRVLFLGTPHAGSPALLKAFTEGYDIVFDSGTWMDDLGIGTIDTISHSLNNCGPSFPSIYQLLPTDENVANFIDNHTHKKRKINLFSPSIWKNRLKWPTHKFVCMPTERYYKKLPELLKNARSFHDFLKTCDPIEEARYIYSCCHKTASELEVTRGENDLYETNLIHKPQSGDGTVPADSAKNWEKTHNADICRTVTFKHRSLPKDPQFIELLENIREEAEAKRNTEMAKAILQSDQLAQLFAHKKLLLEVPISMGTKLCMKQDAPEYEPIYNANFKTLQIMTGTAKAELIGNQIYRAIKSSKNKDDKIQLGMVYLAGSGMIPSGTKWVDFASPLREAWVANNMGHIMLEKKNWDGAEIFLEASVSASQKIRDTEQKKELRGKTLNNLGFAVLKGGNTQKAKSLFLEASTVYQNPKAGKNLEMHFKGIEVDPESKHKGNTEHIGTYRGRTKVTN